MEHVNFVNSIGEKDFYDCTNETLWDWYCALYRTPDSVDVGNEELNLNYQFDRDIFFSQIIGLLLDAFYIPFPDRDCLVMKCIDKLVSYDFPIDRIPPPFRHYCYYISALIERCQQTTFHH